MRLSDNHAFPHRPIEGVTDVTRKAIDNMSYTDLDEIVDVILRVRGHAKYATEVEVYAVCNLRQRMNTILLSVLEQPYALTVFAMLNENVSSKGNVREDARTICKHRMITYGTQPSQHETEVCLQIKDICKSLGRSIKEGKPST